MPSPAVALRKCKRCSAKQVCQLTQHICQKPRLYRPRLSKVRSQFCPDNTHACCGAASTLNADVNFRPCPKAAGKAKAFAILLRLCHFLAESLQNLASGPQPAPGSEDLLKTLRTCNGLVWGKMHAGCGVPSSNPALTRPSQEAGMRRQPRLRIKTPTLSGYANPLQNIWGTLPMSELLAAKRC